MDSAVFSDLAAVLDVYLVRGERLELLVWPVQGVWLPSLWAGTSLFLMVKVG